MTEGARTGRVVGMLTMVQGAMMDGEQREVEEEAGAEEMRGSLVAVEAAISGEDAWAALRHAGTEMATNGRVRTQVSVPWAAFATSASAGRQPRPRLDAQTDLHAESRTEAEASMASRAHGMRPSGKATRQPQEEGGPPEAQVERIRPSS